MSNTTPDWSKNQFLGYLFLYCANADYIEQEAEKSFILSKISDEVFQEMHAEFDKDSDYDRVQKIASAVEKHYPTETGRDSLVAEIKDLFLSDGEFDLLERNIFLGLKKLISH